MKKFVRLSFALLLILGTITSFAGNNKITLYSQPDTQSKAIATIKLPASFVEIYTQGDWVKVGNTKDGQVGWVQQKTLKKANGNSVFSTTFTKTDQDGGQVIQYTGTVKLDKKQIKQMIQKMQNQQQQMQKQMNKMFQQNMDEFNQFMKNFWKENQTEMKQIEAPVGQAIIIVPAKQKGSQSKPLQSTQQHTKPKKENKSWWQSFKEKFM